MPFLKSILLSTVACLSVLALCSCDADRPSVAEGVPGEALFGKVVDGAGREVVFDQIPQRIVSLSPVVTETLFAIGEGARLVGRTQYCLWPSGVDDIPIVGGISDPNVEYVLSLKPDLVVFSKLSSRDIVNQFENLGVKTLVFSFQTIDEVAREMAIIADVCHASDGGRQFISSFSERLANVRKLATTENASRRPRVLLLLGVRGLYSAGEKSYAGDLIELAGGENLAARTGMAWPQVSLEGLLEWDPEVILVAIDHGVEGNGDVLQVIEGWKKSEPWRHLSAVRYERIFLMNDSIMTIQGPRLADAAERIYHLLHPDEVSSEMEE